MRVGDVEWQTSGEVALRAQRGFVSEQQPEALGRIQLAAEVRGRPALGARHRLPPGVTAVRAHIRHIYSEYRTIIACFGRRQENRPSTVCAHTNNESENAANTVRVYVQVNECVGYLLKVEFCRMNSRIASA